MITTRLHWATCWCVARPGADHRSGVRLDAARCLRTPKADSASPPASWPSRFGLGLAMLVGACLSVAGAVPASATEKQPPQAKNVILLIADGAGFNTWIATSMYRGTYQAAQRELYQAPEWVHLGVTTYPLTLAKSATLCGTQDPKLVYDPTKAWSGENDPGGVLGQCDGYRFLASTATDSAAAGSAMATGQKTYNSAINWSDLDFPYASQTLAELAKTWGKSVGVVTSVPWSHATPACLGGAHQCDRERMEAIANEMLSAPYLDVIMGAGHPEFDDDGRPLPPPADEKSQRSRYKYVGGKSTWLRLVSGEHPQRWTLIQTRDDFEALAHATQPPAKVLGVAQVATTLQQHRSRGVPASTAEQQEVPQATPYNANVPTLATMTRAALNCLDENPAGLFLMVEGGAVDWANHANQLDRMIEEHIDFLQAVEAVVQWVETNSSWDQTLVILTADHECGLLWGPQSHQKPFDPLVDRGKGQLPGARYNHGSHTNSLVPLYCRGPGSQAFLDRIRGTDEKAGAVWGFSGQYVDNTDLFHVMAAVLRPAPSQPGVQQSVPAPAAPGSQGPKAEKAVPAIAP